MARGDYYAGARARANYETSHKPRDRCPPRRGSSTVIPPDVLEKQKDTYSASKTKPIKR